MKLGNRRLEKIKNYFFVGEAGSGKSEIAINYAQYLLEGKSKKVHFFDMDMTKPLFRSRDVRQELEHMGIEFHYEEQFMDAPTLVGGVRRLLKNQDSYVVIDVGGDHIGARALGGFASFFNQDDCTVFYVINSYRPWSLNMEHIDLVLGEILGVSRIPLECLHIISNPNIGSLTETKDVLKGHRRLEEMINQYKDISLVCVREELYESVKGMVTLPIMAIHLFLEYPWQDLEKPHNNMLYRLSGG